jgi:O-antigen ligase
MISRSLLFFFAFVVVSGALKPQTGYTFLENPMLWGMAFFSVACFFSFWVIPVFRFKRENHGRIPVRHLIRLSPVLYLMPLLLAMWVSSLINAAFRMDGLGSDGVEKLIRFTFLTVPICLVLPIIARQLEDIYYYYSGLIAIAIFVAIILLLTLDPVALGLGRYQSSGELIGLGIVILLPIAFSRGAFTWPLLLFICICALMLSALFLSAARGAIIGLSVIWLINFWKSKYRTKIIHVCLLIIMVLAVQIILPETFIDRTSTRLDRGIDNYQLEGGRRQHLHRGLQLFDEHPIFGVGAGWYGWYVGKGETDYPHNAFIEALCEFGILGGIAYLFAVGSGFQGIMLSLKRQPNNTFYTATLYIWIYTFLISMKSGDFNSNRSFWIINALGIYFQYFNRISKNLGNAPQRNRVRKLLFAPNPNRRQLFNS